MNKVLLIIISMLFFSMNGAGQVMPITSSSQEAIDSFKEGRDIFHLAWFEEAPAKLEEAIKIDSTLAVAYIYLAMTEYFQFHDPSASVERARLFGKEASDGEKWLIEGWAKFIMTDYMGTVKYVDSLLSKYPDDDYAKHILGFSYRDAGEPQKAVEVLSELTEREDPFGPAYNHLAFSYADLKNIDLANTVIDKFVEWDRNNPSAYDSRAHLYYNMGRYNLAISYFARATIFERRFAYSQRFLAHSFMMLKESLAAREAYKRADEMSSTYHERFRLSLLRFIGYTYIAEGDDKNVEKYFKKVVNLADSLSSHSTKLSAIESLTKYFLHRKNVTKAKLYLDKYHGEMKQDSDRVSDYEFYRVWLQIIMNPNINFDSLINRVNLGDEKTTLLTALYNEYKADYNSAIKEYEKLEAPDIYFTSRILGLTEKTGDSELNSKIRGEMSNWRGYPNLDYALSVLNTN